MFVCVCLFVCMGKPTSGELGERKKESSAWRKESNRFFFIMPKTVFINYVDLSWPIEILIGLFECECVQCTHTLTIFKCMDKNDGTFTWTFFLCVCGLHVTLSLWSALLLHQYGIIRISFYLITVMCVVFSFRLVFVSPMRRALFASMVVIKTIKESMHSPNYSYSQYIMRVK